MIVRGIRLTQENVMAPGKRERHTEADDIVRGCWNGGEGGVLERGVFETGSGLDGWIGGPGGGGTLDRCLPLGRGHRQME